MSDSDELDALDAKHERQREQRIERVRRWAQYVKTAPVEEWGPQQVKLVDAQLEAARQSGLSADHYRRIKSAGERYRREQTPSE